MKTPYLPIIVVVSALSLASANAMPDLGRETGRFIRRHELAPKDVRTFTPGKQGKSETNTNASFAFGMPVHPTHSEFGALADLDFSVPTVLSQAIA
jgi:hypothetical protein